MINLSSHSVRVLWGGSPRKYPARCCLPSGGGKPHLEREMLERPRAKMGIFRVWRATVGFALEASEFLTFKLCLTAPPTVRPPVPALQLGFSLRSSASLLPQTSTPPALSPCHYKPLPTVSPNHRGQSHLTVPCWGAPAWPHASERCSHPVLVKQSEPGHQKWLADP